MSTSPTQRTLKKWRDAGYQCAVVEYWNSFTKRRKDMFGLFDIVAVGNAEVVFIQTTSRDNIAARIWKVEDPKNNELIAACREANVRLIVEGWKKMASGKWECREVDLS